jgi:hypothetical protein
MKQKTFHQRQLENDEAAARLEALEFQTRKMTLQLIGIERVLDGWLSVCNCPACRRRRAELAEALAWPVVH